MVNNWKVHSRHSVWTLETSKGKGKIHFDRSVSCYFFEVHKRGKKVDEGDCETLGKAQRIVENWLV